MSPRKRASGFTLVEVLIALAILAIALAAASRASRVAIDSAQEAKLRTMATWVAQNRLAELIATKAFPGAGNNSGHSSMGGVDFEWRETTSETANTAFRKVELKVLRPNDEQSLASLTAYLVRAGTASSQ